MAKYPKMNLISFQKQFSTHEACQNHLFKLKWSTVSAVKNVVMTLILKQKHVSFTYTNASNAVTNQQLQSDLL